MRMGNVSGVAGRIVGLFAAFGLAAGMGTMLYFDHSANVLFASVDGVQVAAAWMVLISMTASMELVVLVVGVLLAAVGGVFAAREIPGRGDAAAAGALGAIAGYVVMAIVFALVAEFGTTMVFEAHAESGTLDESSYGEGVFRIVNALLMGAVPAAVVGAVGAVAFRPAKLAPGGASPPQPKPEPSIIRR